MRLAYVSVLGRPVRDGSKASLIWALRETADQLEEGLVPQLLLCLDDGAKGTQVFIEQGGEGDDGIELWTRKLG